MRVGGGGGLRGGLAPGHQEAAVLRNAPLRNNPRVSWCDATHCKSASALHTRFDACAVKVGGESIG